MVGWPEVAHGDGPGVTHVVADEANETGSAFPGAPAHVHDATVKNVGIFRAAVPIVEAVAAAVYGRATQVSGGLGVRPWLLGRA